MNGDEAALAAARKRTALPTRYPTLDVGLIERARTGDREAFGLLSEEMEPRLRAYILRLTGRPDAAEQITQEALARALDDLGNRPADLQFSSWLFRIAANLVTDGWRRNAAAKTYSLEERLEDRETGRPDSWRSEGWSLHTDLVANGSATSAQDPLDVLLAAEDRAAGTNLLARTMAALPPEYRQALVLKAQECSYAEIAERLGQTVKEVKLLLARARKRARHLYTDGKEAE